MSTFLVLLSALSFDANLFKCMGVLVAVDAMAALSPQSLRPPSDEGPSRNDGECKLGSIVLSKFVDKEVEVLTMARVVELA